MLGGLKRGDTVVLSSGMIGKIVRVEDKEVGVEIATGVTVKVRQEHDRRGADARRAGARQQLQELGRLLQP